MILKQLYLKNFRNYSEGVVQFTSGLNLVYGENGQGKTNLLEAIYLLSTGRSFRTNHLDELILHGQNEFHLQAIIEKDGLEHTLSFHYSKKERSFFHNQTKYHNFSSVLGIFPSVIFSPADILLINGAPHDRRKFINLHIAQFDPLYVYHLTRFNKALKHRNILLKNNDHSSIHIWEKEMAKSSFYIFSRRALILAGFEAIMNEEGKSVSQACDFIELRYHPHCRIESEESILEGFVKNRAKDALTGYTSIGPHRDDYTIMINHKIAKSFASEGQKRTLLALIRLTQYKLFKQEFEDLPLFSIDDFGIHLDDTRKLKLTQRLEEFSQVILTSPHKEAMAESQAIYIENGAIYSSSFK